MLLIPAIDLKDGHCVRLEQGDMKAVTTFSENPAAMARRWLDAGARRLHLVDLNGAFAGKPVNESAIKAILAEVGDEIPVQLGGGIRDLDTIERYLDDGLSFVIIGTAAVKNPGFLHDACTAFGGHIIVADHHGLRPARAIPPAPHDQRAAVTHHERPRFPPANERRLSVPPVGEPVWKGAAALQRQLQLLVHRLLH